jgi:hypothetical protein
LGHFFRVGARARGDAFDVESGFEVRREVALAHDPPTADDPDRVWLARQQRLLDEIKV